MILEGTESSGADEVFPQILGTFQPFLKQLFQLESRSAHAIEFRGGVKLLLGVWFPGETYWSSARQSAGPTSTPM